MSAVNKELQVGVLKPSTVKARRYTKNVYSLAQNTSYGENDNIIFNIPIGVANTFLDGKTMYLKFTATFTYTATGAVAAPTASYLDYSASCFFRQLILYGNSSQTIEKIDRYNVLSNTIYDTAFTQSQLKGLSPLIGTAEGDTTDATLRYGKSFTVAAMAGAGTSTVSAVFCIPIFSCIGQLSEKYLPIFAMSGDSLRLELVLDSNVNAFYYDTAADADLASVKFTVSNPELFYDCVEIDPSAMGAIESLYSGRDIVLHSSSYTTYEASLPANTSGNYQLILPAKNMSVKSIQCVHRFAAVQAQNSFTLSNFSNVFDGVNSSWNLSLSGLRVPSKPIIARIEGDISQFFAELQKSNHALAYTDYVGTLNYDCYQSSTNTAVGATPNNTGFIVGLNLSSITNSEDSILSGLDLSKETVHLEYNLATQITTACLVNSFLYHDVLLTIQRETGILTGVF